MAIIKDIPTEYGVNFKYHKISDIKIINDRSTTQVRIIVSSYADEQARKDKKTPVKKECIISNGEFALTAFYEILKKYFPEFDDGDDELTNDYKPAGETVLQDMQVVEQSLVSNSYKVIPQGTEEQTNNIATEGENDE